MTIILPQDYRYRKDLEKLRIHCITPEQAQRQDIRALRIGILNIMPEAHKYEFNLLYPLGRSVLQIEPVWIKLESHVYKSSDHEHLKNVYKTYEEANKEGKLDALIVTGAPVELLEFEEVLYWDEIKEILEDARKNIFSTLGICWGGLALAYLMGIPKINYPKKLFGVFEVWNIDRTHPVTGNMDDVFWVPQSRHAGIRDEDLEDAARNNEVRLLAYGKEVGYTIFESYDRKFLIHLGHPEYNTRRLIEEYERDMKKGRTDVDPPKNIDFTNPINRWRSHRNEFFTEWIRYCYSQLNLDLYVNFY